MGNRNLVVVRAGDQSLHPAWTDSLATRDWDLVVSYFGRDDARFRSDGEQRLDDPGQKFEGLHALLTRDAWWHDYDYVWLPDDDLATDQHSVGELFRMMRAGGLALAQPSLSWASYYSYGITLHHPSFVLRVTNVVEIMAPCFSVAALAQCLPTFTENLSGWGLSFVWPRMLPPGALCGVVDAVQVTHTRPVGGPAYARLAAEGVSAGDERAQVLARHGIAADIRPVTLGGWTRDGRTLRLDDPAGAAALRDLDARDGTAYAAHIRQHPLP